jgi:aminomethyltransferase
MNKKTPLFQEHAQLQAKMAAFAGYDMPIQYPLGVIKEHEWTRTNAGLFDVSHMGQAIVSGAGSADFFSRITPSLFLKTPHGMAKYTVLTNDKGGIIDDLIITRMTDDKFFVVFNAGRKDVDIAWFKKNLSAGLKFEELADNALIALQGPKAEEALSKEFPDAKLSELGYMRLMEASWKGSPVIISRLGYTGEDGFEISVPANKASEFWNSLLKNPQVQAIGLAARDSLRLEMGYPLYGHDLNEDTTPVEANIAWIISKEHKGFIGDSIVLAQLASGPAKKRVGVKLLDAGIAREGSGIYSSNEKVGELTSGGFSPSLKTAIGQGYIDSKFAAEGQKVEVEVRGKRIAGVVHNLAFMPANTKRAVKKELSAA